MTHYLAIDPGTSWVGMADLRYSPRRGWRGRSATLDIRGLSFVDQVWHLVPYIEAGAEVVVENYQVRTQGFNAFSGATTLKLLGAIEWVCQERKALLSVVQPGTPKLALKLWPKVPPEFFQSHGRGDHMMSAWRILGTHLLKISPTIPQQYDGALL